MSQKSNATTENTGIVTGYKQLLAEANESVRTYSVAEAIERFDEEDCVFVDVRDEPELEKNGTIPGSIHASRGMLEFHLDPESPYFIEELGSGKELLFYCAVGGRSALAAQRAGEMGVASVAHVEGGFAAWTEAGGPVENGRSNESRKRASGTNLHDRSAGIRLAHEGDLDWEERTNGGRLAHRSKGLGAATGGQQLGCSLYEVPPGKRSWPYHYHTANEEAVYVLDGRGTLRTPNEDRPLEPGTYVSLPAGAGNARQIHNASDETLRYLCFSTTITPEVVYHVDSTKFGLFGGADPLSNPEGVTLFEWVSVDEGVVEDVWYGEE